MMNNGHGKTKQLIGMHLTMVPGITEKEKQEKSIKQSENTTEISCSNTLEFVCASYDLLSHVVAFLLCRRKQVIFCFDFK